MGVSRNGCPGGPCRDKHVKGIIGEKHKEDLSGYNPRTKE